MKHRNFFSIVAFLAFIFLAFGSADDESDDKTGKKTTKTSTKTKKDVSSECAASNKMGYPMKCVPCCEERFGGHEQCYLHCGAAGN